MELRLPICGLAATVLAATVAVSIAVPAQAYADQGAPIDEIDAAGPPPSAAPEVLQRCLFSSWASNGAVVAESCLVDGSGQVRSATEYRDFNAQGYPAWAYHYDFGELVGMEEYVYDEWGRLASVDSIAPDGTYQFNTQFLYYDPAMPDEFPDGVDVMSTVMSWDTFEQVGGGAFYCFDEWDRLIAYIAHDADGVVSYKELFQYDSDGPQGVLVAQSNYYAQDAFAGRTEYFHDETGRLVSSLSFDADGNLSAMGSYRYDESGRLLALDTYAPDDTLELSHTFGWAAPEQLVGQPAPEEVGSRIVGATAADGGAAAGTESAPTEIVQDGALAYVENGIELTCAGGNAVVTLPASWDSRFVATAGFTGDGHPVCTVSAAHEGVGTLFEVMLVPQVDEVWPNYRIVGETSAGIVVVLMPTDLQCDPDVPGALEEYESLAADVQDVVANMRLTDGSVPDAAATDGVAFGDAWLGDGTYYFALSMDGEPGCVAQVDITRYEGTQRGCPYGTFACTFFHGDGTPVGTYGTTGTFSQRLDLGILYINSDDVHFSSVDGWSFYWQRTPDGYEYAGEPTMTSKVVRTYEEAVQTGVAPGSGDDPAYAGITYWRGLELQEGTCWVVGDVYLRFSDVSATGCTAEWVSLADASINGQQVGRQRCAFSYYRYGNDPTQGVYLVIDGLQFQWADHVQGDWVESHALSFVLVEPDYTLSDYPDLDLVSVPGLRTEADLKAWVMTGCDEGIWAPLQDAVA